jgi:membrane fusion protein, multidrug efflux system
MFKGFLAFIFIVIISAGLYGIKVSGILNKEAKNSQIIDDKTVRVAQVVASESGTVLPLVGRVQANKSLKITPEVTARVSKIFVKSTQSVKKGDILIELDNVKEKAHLKEAIVNYENQLRKLKVSRTLKAKGVVSLDALDQLEAAVEAQKAIVQAREVELNERTIYAPFSGVLSLHQLTEGQFVKPGNILLQLDDLSKVYVDFQIPERFLSQIVVGQEVTAVTDAWPGRIYVGRIEEIDTHVNSDTLAIKVRIYFANKSLELLDGMMLEMSLNLATEKLPVVPLKAISYSGDDRFVYILRNNIVSRRKVILGPVNGANVSIKQGLRVNSTVVVEGIEKLHDGDKVSILKKDDELDFTGDVPLKKKDKKNNEDIVL